MLLLAMLFCITLQTMAQTDGDNPEDREVDMDTPTFEPMVKVGKCSWIMTACNMFR